MKNIWDDIRTVKLFSQNDDISFLQQVMAGLKDNGVNINEVECIIWTEDDELKNLIASKLKCQVLSKKDFNWLGKIKDQSLKNRIYAKADLVLSLEAQPEKLKKILSSLPSKYSVSLNEKDSFAKISLQTDKVRGDEQINFLKETLQKIQAQ